jgi:hypothetical protein
VRRYFGAMKTVPVLPGSEPATPTPDDDSVSIVTMIEVCDIFIQ